MKRVICYGGAGALGRAVVELFNARGVTTISVDVAANPNASLAVTVNPNSPFPQQQAEIAASLRASMKGEKAEAIICVAGGWAGGNIADSNVVASTVSMFNVSVMTSVIAASLAPEFLVEGGLVVLTGSQAALGATPGMIGYGTAKAAVHQLVHSLAASGSGLPRDSVVVGIMPETLDTPANRAGMPNADFSNWTPCEEVADKLHQWTTKASAPQNGGLLKITTRGGATKYEYA